MSVADLTIVCLVTLLAKELAALRAVPELIRVYPFASVDFTSSLQLLRKKKWFL